MCEPSSGARRVSSRAPASSRSTTSRSTSSGGWSAGRRARPAVADRVAAPPAPGTHPGKVVLHTELLTKVWGPEYRDDLQYLRVWISRVRRKLGAKPGEPGRIRTFQGIGYLLDVEGTAGGGRGRRRRGGRGRDDAVEATARRPRLSADARSTARRPHAPIQRRPSRDGRRSACRREPRRRTNRHLVADALQRAPVGAWPLDDAGSRLIDGTDGRDHAMTYEERVVREDDPAVVSPATTGDRPSSSAA